MLAPFLSGFALGLSLILAIGAQNAFVLRQGLRGEHLLPVVLTCAVSDALLIVAGVAGFGALIEAAPWILPLFRWGGAAFLVVYGARAALSAWRGGGAMEPAGAAGGLRRAVLTCLALTWLNPHVYLDTVVLLGSLSGRYDGAERAAYGGGAMLASLAWFFALGYGARLLAPIFAKPTAWRVLDVGIGLVMWGIALKLALDLRAGF